MKKLSILIPVYNEAPTVATLLQQVFEQPLPNNLKKEMIIIESNSTDGSRQIVKNFVTNASSPQVEIKLILQEVARGKGNAVRAGLAQATGDIVLIQDADLEYKTSDYPNLLQPILDGHADFVLGSRHLSAGSWKIRKFEKDSFTALIMNLGGIFFHTLFNIMFGTRLTDPTTMFKVFRLDCLKGVVLDGNRFDFDYELAGKLIRLGYMPLEVPVSYTSRGFNEGKKIRIFRDPFNYIFAIVKYRLVRIKRVPRSQQKIPSDALSSTTIDKATQP